MYSVQSSRDVEFYVSRSLAFFAVTQDYIEWISEVLY
jgi:hypothetical protein